MIRPTLSSLEVKTFISRACETLGRGGPKSVDLSANVLPFLVINLAYLISASWLTRTQPRCWPPDLALYLLHYCVKKILSA